MLSSPDKLLLLAAHSREGLRAQLKVDAELLLGRDDVQTHFSNEKYRLAILNADTRRLELAGRIVEGGASWRGRKDIWFTESPLLEDKGVALIFPGLEQRFDLVIDDVASHFCWSSLDLTDSKRSVRQHSISLLEVESFLGAALREIGVEPIAVAGHSIGEWSAMMSAGLISSTSMESFIVGANPAVFELPNCIFAALGCGVEMAEQAVLGIDRVVISHDNCPHQSIVCGEQDAIDIVLRRLGERGVATKLLNFRSGFHSPFLKPHLHWVSKIAELPLETPSIPVWSATTTRPFPSNEKEIRDLMIRHLLEPVRFRELIQNLYASGVRAFVQVGVGSVSSFIDDTLEGQDYVAISASVAGQPGMRQLRRTAAALWVEGAKLQLDRLVGGYSQVEYPQVVSANNQICS